MFDDCDLPSLFHVRLFAQDPLTLGTMFANLYPGRCGVRNRHFLIFWRYFVVVVALFGLF